MINNSEKIYIFGETLNHRVGHELDPSMDWIGLDWVVFVTL